MKITEVSADGLGVSALIAAAGKIADLLDERAVTLGVIEAEGVAVVMGKRDSDSGLPILAVTVERKPRLIRLEADDQPEPVVEHGHQR